MKIVIASDKYKGNLSAVQVCNIIKEAILDYVNLNYSKKDLNVEVVISPMADGGDGTVDTLVESLSGEFVKTKVKNPLGKEIQSYFGLIDSGKTAVIEMSLASGLALIKPQERNPLITTTYGTGQLIRKALDINCKKIIIGIGGSATNDAGVGALQALGVKFLDKENNEIGYGGGELIKIDKIDISNIHPRIKETQIFIACDVDNPLYGLKGAAYVYGPQKGADEKTVEFLDKGLRKFSKIVKKYLGKDISKLKGGGAAGGLGAGLHAFLSAKLAPGAELVIQATGLEDKIKGANLIITGEGAMDNQTFFGKTAFGVANLALKYKVPVITINGSLNLDYSLIEQKRRQLFLANFDIINKPMSLDEALKNSKKNLYFTAQEIIKLYLHLALKCCN